MLTGFTRGDLNSLKDKKVDIDKVWLDRFIDLVQRMTSKAPEDRPDINEIIKTLRFSKTG
jgi:hypothetical protein